MAPECFERVFALSNAFVVRYFDELVCRRSRVLVPHFQQRRADGSGLAVTDLLSVPFDHRRDFDRASDEHHLCCVATFCEGKISDSDGVERALLDEPLRKIDNPLNRDPR